MKSVHELIDHWTDPISTGIDFQLTIRPTTMTNDWSN